MKFFLLSLIFFFSLKCTAHAEIQTKISEELEALSKKYYLSFSGKDGKINGNKKHVGYQRLEYSLVNAANGKEEDKRFFKQRLKSGWGKPDYEKDLAYLADNLLLYSYAYSIWHKEDYGKTATNIYNYLRNFIATSEAVFDTAAKAKTISSLAVFYSATLNKPALEDAQNYIKTIIKDRSPTEGGFKLFEDSLYMSKAFLDLYMVTADKKWLERSESAATYTIKNFSGSLASARIFNLLYHYTGKNLYREQAESMLKKFRKVQEKSEEKLTQLLMTITELNSEPLHITIVGHKDDPSALELFQSGLKYFSQYKRLEWWDKREGPMPNPDVTYPEMQKAAAFICTNKRCSLPIFEPKKIPEIIQILTKSN